jgi:4-amino-4-deoxy-L-arabinose transferase-like glycosyltransferase
MPVVLLTIFHLVVNLLWLKFDQLPPAWDQAFHLHSVLLTKQWFGGAFWGNWVDLIKAFYGYPPLIYFFGAFYTFISGATIKAISSLNTVFLIISLVGLYFLTRLLVKEKKSLLPFLSVLLFSFFPVVYDISRNLLLDLPLIMFTVWGLYFYLKSDYLNQKRPALGWALCLSFASLTKLNGFLYFSPMVLFSLFICLTEKKAAIVKNLFLSLLVYLLLVGWWWVVNYQNIFNYLTGLAGKGEPLTDPMNLLNITTWFHYFRLFFLHQVFPFTAIIFLISIPFFQKANSLKKEAKLFFWFYLLFNYILFTVIKNKDFRFTMPLLPVVAIITTVGINQLKKPLSYLLAFILCLYLGFHFVDNSFNWPVKKDFKISTNLPLVGYVDWVNFSNYPVRSPNRFVWPQKQVVADIIGFAKTKPERQKVLVLLNIEEFNDNNLRVYRELATDKGDTLFEVYGTGEKSGFNDEIEIKKFLKQFNLILLPQKGMIISPFYALSYKALQQLNNYLWQHLGTYQQINKYSLPNNQTLYLLSNLF